MLNSDAAWSFVVNQLNWMFYFPYLVDALEETPQEENQAPVVTYL